MASLLRALLLGGVLNLALYVSHAHADEYTAIQALLAQGQSAQALTQADAYIATKPRDPQMRFLRGVILTEQGKKDDAIQTFVSLTQDFPELPEPYNNLAALYASQNQFDKARAALETAIQMNPNYATAYENLGDVYLRLAAQSYARARQFASSNPSAATKLEALHNFLAPPKAPTPASSSSSPKEH